MSCPPHPSDPLTQTLELHGLPVAYTDVGDGPVVVGVHGYPGGHHDYRWLGAALEPEVRFIRVAMPGFESTALPQPAAVTIADRGRWLADVIVALDLQDIVLVGHSMGGAIAGTAAAHLDGRVRGLALLCSLGPIPHPMVARARLRLAARLVHTPLLGTLLKRRLPAAFARAGFRRPWSVPTLVHVLDCAAALDFNGWTQTLYTLTQRKLPTLVAWSEDDKLVPPPVSEALAAAAPDGPRLRFEQGGHSIQKHHATELAQAIFALTDRGV